MNADSMPCISLKKRPQQQRSEQLVAAILEAATQVLHAQGSAGFTTAKVAERAGVSIGSLYQYFPNKAAILFRLQVNEWHASMQQFAALISASQSPLQRLRALVNAFIQSECAEANIRRALVDLAPFYRKQPEAETARTESRALFNQFIKELLPHLDGGERALTQQLISTTITAGGKVFSEQPRTSQQIHQYSEMMADMLCGYIHQLNTP